MSWGLWGIDKTREGDLRSPTGSYSLGSPRKSYRDYAPPGGMFIPVGYPRTDQVAAGFTGGAIGIHGPARMAAWLGSFLTLINWTEGCIVVSSDAEMDEIIAWMGATKVRRILIR